MADVAATSTDKRSVTFLTTYNTRSVHAVTRRAQQNLGDFTAIRPCFQQLLAAFGLSSKMIICDVVVKNTIFKPEHQKTFRAIPERVCEAFSKKNKCRKTNFLHISSQLDF